MCVCVCVCVWEARLHSLQCSFGFCLCTGKAGWVAGCSQARSRGWWRSWGWELNSSSRALSDVLVFIQFVLYCAKWFVRGLLSKACRFVPLHLWISDDLPLCVIDLILLRIHVLRCLYAARDVFSLTVLLLRSCYIHCYALVFKLCVVVLTTCCQDYRISLAFVI